jgi:hypothetical protein
MIDLKSLRVVCHRESVNNLIYGVIAIAQLPDSPSGFTHWDRGSAPLIEKEKAVVWEAVCFNIDSPNQHTFPRECGCGFLLQAPLWAHQETLFEAADARATACCESRALGSSDYRKHHRRNISNLLCDRSSRNRLREVLWCMFLIVSHGVITFQAPDGNHTLATFYSTSLDCSKLFRTAFSASAVLPAATGPHRTRVSG